MVSNSQSATFPQRTTQLISLLDGEAEKGSGRRASEGEEKQGAGLTLNEKVVSPGLHERYAIAASRILRFWRECQSSPSAWEDMDVGTSQWLEHIFAEGYPKGYGSDGVAALQHFLPEVAGKPRHSWRLLKSWQKMGPPGRVLPISPLMVMAISANGMAVLCGCIPVGF